jgi:hypothetical protein
MSYGRFSPSVHPSDMKVTQDYYVLFFPLDDVSSTSSIMPLVKERQIYVMYERGSMYFNKRLPPILLQ